MAWNIEQDIPGVQYNNFNTAKFGTVSAPTGAFNVDLSSSTGTFKTPTGVTTVGGNLVVNGSLTTTGGRLMNIVSGQGATSTLTAAQSGSLVLFDRAAGIVYTLPAASAGLEFTFLTTVTITSNAAEVAVANEATTFISGSILSMAVGATNGTTTPFMSVGDGATHVEVTSNGTTTGGIAGSWYTIRCLSATLWFVSGTIVGSGTLATPFST